MKILTFSRTSNTSPNDSFFYKTIKRKTVISWAFVMKAPAMDVVVALLPLCMNQMFLNSSVNAATVQ